ncbi:MAG: histidine phosphatase family protein [Planctomycetes bacterium]|nr:histidine phosphatase family protein [Planctomycetota bacterium]
MRALPRTNRPITIHWIRHGEVELDGGVERVYGDMEMPLSARGIQQLEDVAADLQQDDPRLSAVYASNLGRAIAGATSIAKLQNLTIRVEPAFREIYRGAWRGLTWPEVEARFPGGARRFVTESTTYRDHGGETMDDVERRAIDGWSRILNDNHEKPGGAIAVVSHSWIVRVVIARVLGLDAAGALRISSNPGSISTIDGDASGWRIICINRSVIARTRPTTDETPRPTG